MPTARTLQRAKKAKQEGKSPSTQAGEFVREEMEHIRHGKHGAKSTKQAIAIGLSKARRAGVRLKPPAKGTVSEKTRKSAESAYEKGQRHEPVSKTRSTARRKVLRKESTSVASHSALSRQAHESASKRGRTARSASAKKAASTKRVVNRSTAKKRGSRAHHAKRLAHK